MAEGARKAKKNLARTKCRVDRDWHYGMSGIG